MELGNLTGKVAFVTGTSHGLGKGIALGLAKHGAGVILASRKLGLNEALAEEIRGLGQKALPVAMDVMKIEDISRAVEKSIEAFGRIDILINNAGTSPLFANCIDVEEWAWDKIIDTNLKGLFFCAAKVAREMMKHKYGRIINITSAAGNVGSPLVGPYGASKAAVIQLTKTLALELAPYCITVNAIGPSFFEVGVSEPVLKSREMTESIIKRTPLGRVGLIEDLVSAVVFLSSDSASYITGHTLFVDGGWCAGS